MAEATFRVWRGGGQRGKFQDYRAEVTLGMVALDAVLDIQQAQANDLAVRWEASPPATSDIAG